MTLLFSLMLAAAADVRAVSLSPEVVSGAKPLRLECPVGQSTRVIFPLPDLGVKVSQGAKEKLGLRRLSSRPETVILFAPARHPAKGTLELTGPGFGVLIAAETTERGGSSEIRFSMASSEGGSARPAMVPPTTAATIATVPSPGRVNPPAAKPSPAAQPVVKIGPAKADGPATVPTASLPPSTPESGPGPSTGASALGSPPPGGPSSGPQGLGAQTQESAAVSTAGDPGSSTVSAIEPPPAEPGLDLAGLLSARPTVIGRREGQLGRPVMLLQDALKGQRWVWLRFVLIGGAEETIEEVSYSTNDASGLALHVAERTSKDLLVVVQLAREDVTKKTRVTLKVAKGGTYKFAVSSPTFANFLKGLF